MDVGTTLGRAAGLTKVAGPLGALGRVFARPGGLTHFTSAAGRAGIGQSGQLRGSGGIFALPASAGAQSPLARSVRSGVAPAGLQHPVPVPAAAQGEFERVLPVGPYSAWKALGGVRMARPGSIDLATGKLTPTGSIWKTRAQMYAPDAAAAGAGAGAVYLNNRAARMPQGLPPGPPPRWPAPDPAPSPAPAPPPAVG